MNLRACPQKIIVIKIKRFGIIETEIDRWVNEHKTQTHGLFYKKFHFPRFTFIEKMDLDYFLNLQ